MTYFFGSKNRISLDLAKAYIDFNTINPNIGNPEEISSKGKEILDTLSSGVTSVIGAVKGIAENILPSSGESTDKKLVKSVFEPLDFSKLFTKDEATGKNTISNKIYACYQDIYLAGTLISLGTMI